MELRHLRYFLAVAEELNVTRAALRVGIAQPPLTQQIQALEAELGVALFHRIGRRIELSAAGTVFLAETRAVLDRAAQAVAMARRAGRGEIGKLRIGFTSSASFSPFVTEVLKTYRAQWPEVEVALEEHRSALLIAALKADDLDAAFVRPPLTPDAAIEVQWLVREPMVAAVPVDHSAAGRRAVRLEALRDDPFILYPRRGGSGLSDQIVSECLRLGFSPRVGQEAPELAAAINFVAAGMGIAVVPACMRHLRPDAVRFLTLERSRLRAELGLAQGRADRSETVCKLAHLAGEVLIQGHSRALRGSEYVKS
ncbi:LysR family transcriptional regulator [Plastoroseomonas arctica]|uniref:LysR family transcriptional regulator n=1 Tax=Plastoroseomonas arctica TaxID=1509237 RepID=A0AAF1KPD2_9PROT|nr:LysR family transcriptional regulator [Plastoroseomonas arctica]MBR0655768.1 LysR family transcriptional regulator [Plastoroseomonas arctica]